MRWSSKNFWSSKRFVNEYGIQVKRKNEYHRNIYSQETINSVLFNITLKQVISDIVVLRKRGNDLVGRCPFCREVSHNDKHFVFNDKKQIFKCFHCGKAGRTPVLFYQIYFGVPFHKALELLNKKYIKKPLVIERIGLVKKETHSDESLPF